jgi:hypothetical protein
MTVVVNESELLQADDNECGKVERNVRTGLQQLIYERNGNDC